MRFPPLEALGGPPIHVLTDSELDSMAVVPITLGEAPSRRPDLAIGHPLGGLIGEHPLKVPDAWPANDKHPSTMPGTAKHRTCRTRTPGSACGLAGWDDSGASRAVFLPTWGRGGR